MKVSRVMRIFFLNALLLGGGYIIGLQFRSEAYMDNSRDLISTCVIIFVALLWTIWDVRRKVSNDRPT